MNKRALVLNAFRPGMDMDSPLGFAGRRNEILALTDSLLTAGSVPVIFGDRGLGKTSLARQLERIALGDSILLENLGCAERALEPDQVWTVVWVSCSDETRSKAEVLQRLINDAEAATHLDDLASGRFKTTSTTHRVKLKVYEAEAVRELSVSGTKYSRLSNEEKLLAIVRSLRSKGSDRVLFMLDELDRVGSTRGLASFIKNNSDASTKFVLVGVSQTLSGLLDDHASLERQVAPVVVPRMSEVEQDQAIIKAMEMLAVEGIELGFSGAAVSRISKAAAGLPWFLHVLGQEAVMTAFDGGSATVTEADVEEAISRLAKNRFAQHFSDAYQMAVRESRQREIVLRILARWGTEDIPLKEVYRRAKKLGIRNPSISKRDLMLARHGHVIEAPALRGTGVVRFRNAAFKRYVNLRTALFVGVDQEVEEVY